MGVRDVVAAHGLTSSTVANSCAWVDRFGDERPINQDVVDDTNHGKPRALRGEPDRSASLNDEGVGDHPPGSGSSTL